MPTRTRFIGFEKKDQPTKQKLFLNAAAQKFLMDGS
jgi:hypothetical protein